MQLVVLFFIPILAIGVLIGGGYLLVQADVISSNVLLAATAAIVASISGSFGRSLRRRRGSSEP